MNTNPVRQNLRHPSKRPPRSRFPTRPAFTLVESLVVIVIIAVLAALPLPALARGKVEAAQVVSLSGIVRLSANKSALFELKLAQRAPIAMMLSEGQREGDLEVLEIDENLGKVRINYAGEVTNLTFDADAAQGTLVQPSSTSQEAKEIKASFRLQDVGMSSVFGLYASAANRSLLRPGNLPEFRLSLRSQGTVALGDMLKAIEAVLAQKGIIIRPDRDKFAVAAREGDFGKLSPQLWRLAEALGQPTSKPSVEPREEVLPPGMIVFRQADLHQVLEIYSSLANRALLPHNPLPYIPVTLRGQTILTKVEAIYALHVVLALNDVSITPAGDKFLIVSPTAQTNNVAALLARKLAEHAVSGKPPIPAGMIDFREVELPQFIEVYKALIGRPVEISTGIPDIRHTLRNQTQLSENEVLQAMDLLLGLHGLEIIQQGDNKPLKLVRIEEVQAKQPATAPN